MVDPAVADQSGISASANSSTRPPRRGRATGSATFRALAITMVVIFEVISDGFDQTVPSRPGRVARVAGLLEQLAGPGGERVLARVEQAAGGLQAVAARARRGTGGPGSAGRRASSRRR